MQKNNKLFMNLSAFIAKRYLLKKKTFNLINIISIVSIVSIAIGTMSLVIILSVFNGFENLISDLFVKFNAEIQITSKNGKFFTPDEKIINEIRKSQSVKGISYIIEDNALIKYKDKQVIAKIKGVDANYLKKKDINDIIIDGRFVLNQGGNNFAVLGQGIAYRLNVDVYNFHIPLSIYSPSRKKSFNPTNFQGAFNNVILNAGGVFSIQQDFDSKYVFVPLSVAQELFDYDKQVTAIEIFSDSKDVESIKENVKQLIGNNFNVKNRYEQQEFIYKIMNSEKWAVVMILLLILAIASFSLVGSVTTIIIDKKKDIYIYKSIGMSKPSIKQIFIYNSFMISAIGLSLGLIVGYLICFLQIKFGIIGFQSSGNFIINSYPIKIQVMDIFFIIIPVGFIALIASYFPAKILVDRLYSQTDMIYYK